MWGRTKFQGHNGIHVRDFDTAYDFLEPEYSKGIGIYSPYHYYNSKPMNYWRRNSPNIRNNYKIE
jgi:hypothetical protein